MSPLLRVVRGSPTITCYYGGSHWRGHPGNWGRAGVMSSQVQNSKPRSLIWQNAISQTDCRNWTQVKLSLKVELWNRQTQRCSIDLFQVPQTDQVLFLALFSAEEAHEECEDWFVLPDHPFLFVEWLKLHKKYESFVFICIFDSIMSSPDLRTSLAVCPGFKLESAVSVRPENPLP